MIVELLLGMGIGNHYSKNDKKSCKPKFQIKDNSVKRALESMRESQSREIMRQVANEDALKAVLKEEGYL